MPILNKIPARLLREGVESLLETQAVTLTRPHLRRFHETLGRQFMELGLMDYALDVPLPEVRARFRSAAEHLVQALVGRAEPEPDESRNPWEAEQFLNVIGGFGTPAALGLVAGLLPWQVRSPSREATQAVGRYLAVLCPFLGGAELDVPGLREVLGECERGNASRDMRRFLRPSALGLLAVQEADADGWNAALAALADAHAREAQMGDLQLLPAGLISLRGLMLARLGLNRGMPYRTVSDFIPVAVLDSGP